MYYENDREIIKNACSIWNCLIQNSDIFNKDSKNTVVVIIMNYLFFVIWYDSTELARWKNNIVAFFKISLTDWLFNLIEKFAYIVFDEAHII